MELSFEEFYALAGREGLGVREAAMGWLRLVGFLKL